MPSNLDNVKPRPRAQLRISFDQDREVTPDVVFKAIAAALRPTGCPMCGLAGVDIILREDVILPGSDGPQSPPWAAVLEGGLEGRSLKR